MKEWIYACLQWFCRKEIPEDYGYFIDFDPKGKMYRI